MNGRILGRRAFADGLPAAGAGIRLVSSPLGHDPDAKGRPRVAADAGGRFVIAGLAAGRYEVSAHHARSASRVYEVHADHDLDTDLELVLDADRRIAGIVRDAAGAPVARALAGRTLCNQHASAPIRWSRMSGQFSIIGLLRCAYRLSVTTFFARGSVNEGFNVQPEEDEVSLTLAPSLDVMGQVASADGASPRRFRVTSGRHGMADFDSPDGRFSLRVRARPEGVTLAFRSG